MVPNNKVFHAFVKFFLKSNKNHLVFFLIPKNIQPPNYLFFTTKSISFGFKFFLRKNNK
jgi:hypothetical protein